MNVRQFVNTAIAIANSPTIYYSVPGGDWCKWNGSSWNMDCVCMIKGILWGFNFDQNASHGGAIYGSNGVYDDDADSIMDRCTKTSNNFSNIKYGEIVHMDGHVGVYIGGGQVVESTAWYSKTIISNIDREGNRTKDGRNGGKWTSHGLLSYIDYNIDDDTENTELDNYTDEELAKMVWAGKFGNGKERQEKLGKRYDNVQKIVNSMAGKENEKDNNNNNDDSSNDNDNTIIYTVKCGDTLCDIAHSFGVPWSEIYLCNKDIIGVDPNLIYPGQELIINKK